MYTALAWQERLYSSEEQLKRYTKCRVRRWLLCYSRPILSRAERWCVYYYYTTLLYYVCCGSTQTTIILYSAFSMGKQCFSFHSDGSQSIDLGSNWLETHKNIGKLNRGWSRITSNPSLLKVSHFCAANAHEAYFLTARPIRLSYLMHHQISHQPKVLLMDISGKNLSLKNCTLSWFYSMIWKTLNSDVDGMSNSILSGEISTGI